MKISREAKIGAVTIIALAIFFWGFNFLKGKNIFKRTSTFYAVYNNLGGLKESAAILLNGYKVGQVSGLKLVEFKNEHKIVVSFIVNKDIDVPVGSKAVLISENLMDIKAIQLQLAENAELHQSGDTISSQVQASPTESLDPIVENLLNITTSLDTTTKQLNKLLDTETRNLIKSTISNIEKTTVSLNDMLATGGKVDKVLANVDFLIQQLNTATKELVPIISNMAEITDSIDASEISSLINNTAEAMASVNEIMRKINNEEGSAGMLVNNDSLYIHLNNATKDLDLLLKDLKENPKRYVHFSLFGKK